MHHAKAGRKRNDVRPCRRDRRWSQERYQIRRRLLLNEVKNRHRMSRCHTHVVDFDVEFVRGVKTALFGGEELFFATLRGPGSVWVQSLPFSRLASHVFAAMPAGGESKDEDGIGGLFNIFSNR